MWRSIYPLDTSTIEEFEKKFHFSIDRDMRGFLLEHNGGVPSPGDFPTTVGFRQIARFLDFEDRITKNGAWAINQRLQKHLGKKRIIIGIDRSGGFLCLERDRCQQWISVWSHITGDFDRCLLDIPAFIRRIS